MTFLVPARQPSEELLDDAGLEHDEMVRSLRDLDLVQKAWGAARALERWLLPRMPAGRRFVIVDVGAGSGGVARDLGVRLSRAGRPAAIMPLDLQWRHLAAGRRRHGRDLAAVAADAFSLPLADHAADFTVSTLVFHHFSPDENRALLRELARVSRLGFALLDLRRHRIPWLVVSILGPLFFETKVSVLDGRASVLQGYTPGEAATIAEDAVAGARADRIFPFRLLVSGPGQ